MTSIIASFKKYTDFSGRASRREYWLFVLFFFSVTIFAIIPRVPFIISSIFSFFPSALILITFLNILGLISLLALVASIIPMMAVTIRRLHDVGRSGFWYFIRCVPFIGDIWFLVLTVRTGIPVANEWGPNPLLTPNIEPTSSQEGIIAP